MGVCRIDAAALELASRLCIKSGAGKGPSLVRNELTACSLLGTDSCHHLLCWLLHDPGGPDDTWHPTCARRKRKLAALRLPEAPEASLAVAGADKGCDRQKRHHQQWQAGARDQ